LQLSCPQSSRSRPWTKGRSIRAQKPDGRAELLGFPNVKYDDQVDSVAQALIWIGKRRQNEIRFVVPFVYRGRRRYFGDPDYYDPIPL
jgi:hypothetical protein